MGGIRAVARRGRAQKKGDVWKKKQADERKTRNLCGEPMGRRGDLGRSRRTKMSWRCAAIVMRQSSTGSMDASGNDGMATMAPKQNSYSARAVTLSSG